VGLIVDQFTLQTFTAQGAATVNSATFDLSGYKSGLIVANMTVAGGTPTMQINLQTTVDNVNWVQVPGPWWATNFAGPVAVGATAQVVGAGASGLSGGFFALTKCRLNIVVAGTTPSYTGTIVGIFSR